MSTKTRRPKCAPGYRYLRKGEVVRENDECIYSTLLASQSVPVWYPVDKHSPLISKKAGSIHEINSILYRRKIDIKTPEVKVETKPISNSGVDFIPSVEAPPVMPGYRYLQSGEIIAEGDELFGYQKDWEKTMYADHKVNDENFLKFVYRRKIETSVQKYRPLKVGEVIKVGDEWFSFGLYLQARGWWVGKAVGEVGYKYYKFRRKVPNDYKYEQPAKPSYIVGRYDRVKVSNGHSRFYGATGVVSDCRYMDYGKKICRIKYDVPQEKEGYNHSWFWATELELTEDVQAPEPKTPSLEVNVGEGYRRLGQNERMVEGDDYCHYRNDGVYNWKAVAVRGLARDTPANCAHNFVARRKVEPTYRFLTLDEELQATDEMVRDFNGEEPVWGPLIDIYLKAIPGGCFVGPHSVKYKKFRRKVK